MILQSSVFLLKLLLVVVVTFFTLLSSVRLSFVFDDTISSLSSSSLSSSSCDIAKNNLNDQKQKQPQQPCSDTPSSKIEILGDKIIGNNNNNVEKKLGEEKQDKEQRQPEEDDDDDVFQFYQTQSLTIKNVHQPQDQKNNLNTNKKKFDKSDFSDLKPRSLIPKTVQVFTKLFLIVGAIILSILVISFLMSRKTSFGGNGGGGGGSQPCGSRIKVLGQGLDFEQQSMPYKDNQAERISKLLGQNKTLATHQYDDVLTLNDVFERGHNSSNNGKCLGLVNRDTKMVDWITYGEVVKRTKYIGDGLLQLGLEPRKSFVGIYSINCPEYVLTEYGSYRHSLIVVPIYDTLGPNVASFIVSQTELTCLFCENLNRIDKIISQPNMFKTLKHIVLLKSHLINQEIRQKVLTLEELEQLGQKNPELKDNKPDVNDLALICYTSGTTSTPKGVMLTHQNVIASVATISIHLMDQHATTEDVMISILPLGHMFQRIGEAAVFTEGGKVAYYSGDIRQLAEEILIVKPSIMLAVPRLLNRIYEAIQNKVRDSLIKRFLLRMAFRAKRKDLERHVIRLNTIWDRLVFDRVRENFGSRIRLICVGSAPLSSEVLDFLRVAIGCVISEGYGQTECVGPCTATLMGDHTTEHIGPPLVSAIVKMIDVPEMGYFAEKNQGEILVKGPVVFQGYYKQPEQTAEALDSDGWLHTGDIGFWTKHGTLRLIDRKKNIFKLSQGEYIAPEKIENVLVNSRFVLQMFLYGDGFKSMLVAIVVPDIDYIKNSNHAKLKNIETFDEKTMNKSHVKEIILEDMQTVGRQAELKSFELPKNIYICVEQFTIENDFLTPTMKSKRNVLKKHFEKEIQALYKELESTKPPPSRK